MLFPQITTTRLYFQPFTMGDIDALHQLWTDPDVRRYLWDDEVITRETAEEAVRASLASFQTQRFGFWTLCFRKNPTTLIGFCGLRFFDDPPKIEILYGVAPIHWGKGLATEAARAVLRYGFEELRLEKIWGGADAPNVASIRVLEKLGMIYEKTISMPLGEGPYYSLQRNAFQPDRAPYSLRWS